MKLKIKIWLTAILPMLVLGVIVYIVAGQLVKNAVLTQAYSGMEATTLAIREVWSNSIPGEYIVDENGDLWKGDIANISESTEIVDAIKNATGYDVTVFNADTRILTTFVDESGERQVGTTASDEVVQEVLYNGNDYKSDNVTIFGTRYIVYYVPLYQIGTETPIGMVFLGEAYANINSVITNARVSITITIIIMMVLGAALAYATGDALAKALNKAIKHVDILGDGKLGIEIEQKLVNRKDEVGTMCSRISNLDKNLINMIDEIQVQTNTLSENASYCSSHAQIALDSAGQIEIAAQEVAEATSTQAHDVLEAESNVNNMGSVIEETNEKMKLFSETAGEMAQASVSANKTLGELNDCMMQVKGAVNNIYRQTNETHISVEKIGEMTNMITQIASQTNLLSLNASIEAARAGDMGRGFAVVAEEIRQLADQCNDSAIKIQDVLEQLKNNSDESVSTMETVRKIIDVQENKLTDTNVAFETVVGGIDRTIEEIETINQDLQRLNETRGRVISQVQNVSSLAEQNAASTEETAAAIDEVLKIIADMAGHMENFNNVSAHLKEKASIFTIA